MQEDTDGEGNSDSAAAAVTVTTTSMMQVFVGGVGGNDGQTASSSNDN